MTRAVSRANRDSTATERSVPWGARATQSCALNAQTGSHICNPAFALAAEIWPVSHEFDWLGPWNGICLQPAARSTP